MSLFGTYVPIISLVSTYDVLGEALALMLLLGLGVGLGLGDRLALRLRLGDWLMLAETEDDTEAEGLWERLGELLGL